METSKIKFTLSKVLFPRNGVIQLGSFAILSCKLSETLEGESIHLNEKYHNFTIKMFNALPIEPHKEYTATVRLETDPRYGDSYVIQSLDFEPEELNEESKEALLKICLTERQRRLLQEKYPDPFPLIEGKETEKLLDVKGFNQNLIDRLYQKYEDNYQVGYIMGSLPEFNLTVAIVKQLLGTYGTSEEVVRKVKENIYILADEVWGIGFKKCDKIALSSGMAKNSPFRLKAYIKYYLEQQAQNGNSWVDSTILFQAIVGDLGSDFSDEEIGAILYQMQEEKILDWDEDKTKIFSLKYMLLEQNIHSHLERLLSGTSRFEYNTSQIEEAIAKAEKENGFEFTEEQKHSVSTVLSSNVATLSGCAGVGKSCTVKAVTEIYEQQGLSVAICSLSAKAAARSFEVTQHKASTIHRLLKYSPQVQGFLHNENNPIPNDVVIVDESSFLGGELFESLLKAIPTGGRILLVGDTAQLPSIGTCNVFSDILESGVIAGAVLTKIHRQAAKSGIITMSHKVKNKEQLVRKGWTGSEVRGELQDFILDVYSDRDLGRPKLINYYKNLCPTFKEVEETIVLLPMTQKGEINVFDINTEIQSIYNPESDFKSHLRLCKNKAKEKYVDFREGDRVINRKNNYKATVYDPCEKYDANGDLIKLEKEVLDSPFSFDDCDIFDTGAGIFDTNNSTFPSREDLEEESFESVNLLEERTTEVFNGYCGKIVKVYENYIIINFDLLSDLVIFQRPELINLELGYAITVHSAQGSQMKNVITLIDNSSYIMNSKELLYTAITRAVDKCVLIAQDVALYLAINNSCTRKKQTFLKEFLLNSQK